MRHFGLVKFINEVTTETQNDVPVLKFRVRSFINGQKGNRAEVISEIIKNWDDLQFRFGLLPQKDRQAFEDYMNSFGANLQTSSGLQEEAGGILGEVFFKPVKEFKIVVDSLEQECKQRVEDELFAIGFMDMT